MGNYNEVIILLSVSIIIIIIHISSSSNCCYCSNLFLSQSRSHPQNADCYTWDVLDEDGMINIQLTHSMPQTNKAFSLIAHEA